VSKFTYSELDPGIRETVRRLNDLGFETTDSGDGVSKPDMECAQSVPNVAITCKGKDMCVIADRLMREVTRGGFSVEPVGTGKVFIQATYDPADGTAVIQLIGVSDDGWRK
jgi:hypothetical protein